MKLNLSILMFVILAAFSSCSRGYEPIDYGKEACAHCKMTIVDDRFAAELVDAKGRVFKFDDVACMKQFISEQNKQGDNLLYVEDFLKKDAGVIDAGSAVYLRHEFFASPMNGNYAAFKTIADAQRLKDSLGINTMKWEELK
ncbi:nitrous oxide reductase accessory protein NosL [Polluticoccus soli]|uniref:nitrous oxide reductase accessory protein NosL n=1 Tax=Polluticoccus soli TaxID=3034150 RepID=UPI0023E179A8|nr:nitrous oxide reductase accessory protein NosL [Flavipsychrobacter sp. JY13-12]